MQSNNKEQKTIGFIPWWTENPYQLQLRAELRKQGWRVIGNPPLSLLRILLRRDGLDVVHIHWFHALYSSNYLKMPYAMLLLVLYRLIKNNVMWTVHELDFYESRYPKADALFVRFLMKVCRVLLVHSEYSRKEILQRFNYRGTIITMHHASYNGIYPQDISKSEARKKVGLVTKNRVFLYFGYIKPYKGVEELIDSFHLICESDDILIIAGKPFDAGIKTNISQRAAGNKNIKLYLDYIPDADIQLYFSATDIVVFPFKHTHTSGSLMLALTYGKPVIAPHVASIPEYVDDECAVFFNPDKPGDLQNAIIKARKLDLSIMAEKVTSRTKSLTWENMAHAHSSAYQIISQT